MQPPVRGKEGHDQLECLPWTQTKYCHQLVMSVLGIGKENGSQCAAHLLPLTLVASEGLRAEPPISGRPASVLSPSRRGASPSNLLGKEKGFPFSFGN